MSHATSPRVLAATLAAAATRLAGTVVLDLADMVVGPAVYDERLNVFRTLDGEDLGDDDGTLVVLVVPGRPMDLLREYPTAGAAVRVVNEALRAEWSA